MRVEGLGFRVSGFSVEGLGFRGFWFCGFAVLWFCGLGFRVVEYPKDVEIRLGRSFPQRP